MLRMLWNNIDEPALLRGASNQPTSPRIRCISINIYIIIAFRVAVLVAQREEKLKMASTPLMQACSNSSLAPLACHGHGACVNITQAEDTSDVWVCNCDIFYLGPDCKQTLYDFYGGGDLPLYIVPPSLLFLSAGVTIHDIFFRFRS